MNAIMDSTAVLDLFDKPNLPARMEEVKMLLDAGCQYNVNLLEQVIRWIKPKN